MHKYLLLYTDMDSF